MKKALFLLSLAMVLFTSCGSTEAVNETILTNDMIVKSMNNDTKVITTSGTLCVFQIDWVHSVMNIKIKELNAGINTPVMLEKVSFKSTKGGNTFNVPSIVPIIGGKPATDITFTNLSGLLSEAEIKFQFVYNGNTYFISVVDPLFAYSITTITEVGSENAPYKNSAAKYSVKFDIKNMTATIDIIGAKFADKMPAMDMTIPNVPLIATEEGFIIDIKSVVPMIGKTPYPKYVMTDLSATIKGSALSLKFLCAGKYNTVITATMHKPEISQ